MDHGEKKRDPQTFTEAIDAVRNVNGPGDIDALYVQAALDFEEFYVAMDQAWPELGDTNSKAPFAAGFVAGVLYAGGRNG